MESLDRVLAGVPHRPGTDEALDDDGDGEPEAAVVLKIKPCFRSSQREAREVIFFFLVIFNFMTPSQWYIIITTKQQYSSKHV